MALGPIVDVAIGLIFVYLLLGLIASASQELIAAWLQLRGKYLRSAIAELVGNGNQNTALFQQVFSHGLVRAGSPDRLPSYLPSPTFALALMDCLGDGSQAPVFTQIERSVASLPPGPTRESLRVLLKQAAGDAQALQMAIATWYDQAMDRLTGKYKRWCQNYAASFGLAVAIILNVSSLNIAYALWKDDVLRANVAAAAQAYSDRNQALPGSADEAAQTPNPPSPSVPDTNTGQQTTTASPTADPAKAARDARSALDQNVSQLFELNLPIGWSNAELNKFRGWGFVLALIGWLMTGLAVSLGAPFWFDMLKNVLSVRAAGPKPDRADGTKQN